MGLSGDLKLSIRLCDLRDESARHFNLRFSARRRDTKISRNVTKTQQGSQPRQSAKDKVGIICDMEDKLLYRDEVYAIQADSQLSANDEVQTRVAGQLRFLSSRDH